MGTNNIHLARRYLRALEEGVTGDALAAFFHPDVVQREHPNRLVPAGATRDLPAILEGAERGQKAVQKQRYEVRSAVADGETVAMEVDWSATLLIALANTPAGGTIRAAFGVFLTIKDGRIISQRNYDCFEPF